MEEGMIQSKKVITESTGNLSPEKKGNKKEKESIFPEITKQKIRKSTFHKSSKQKETQIKSGFGPKINYGTLIQKSKNSLKEDIPKSKYNKFKKKTRIKEETNSPRSRPLDMRRSPTLRNPYNTNTSDLEREADRFWRYERIERFVGKIIGEEDKEEVELSVVQETVRSGILKTRELETKKSSLTVTFSEKDEVFEMKKVCCVKSKFAKKNC